MCALGSTAVLPPLPSIFAINLFFQDYEDRVVEEATKDKGLSKEKALKKDREEAEEKETEPFSFENDPGSSNSGYYELQAILTHKVGAVAFVVKGRHEKIPYKISPKLKNRP